MVNALTALNPEAFSRTLMPILKRTSVAMRVGTTRFESDMKVGDTFNRQFTDNSYVADYVKSTDAVIVSHTATNEQLSVDQSKIVTFNLDKVDRIQNLPDFAAFKANESAHRLTQDVDQKWLEQVTNADLDVDDGDIGGTSGNPISLSTSNTYETFSTVFAELGQNSVERDSPWFAVVDHKIASLIAQSNVANGFKNSDDALTNGFRGDFAGLDIFVSENLKASASLAIATNLTADDTIVINGVTMTAKAVPSVAGEFDIAASAALTVDNIVALINNSDNNLPSAGSATTYFEFTQADRAKIDNTRVVATDNTTAIGLTGAGRMTLAETLTDATDGFGSQTLLSFCGKMGTTDIVMQSGPTIEQRLEPKNLSTNFLAHILYGVKMFDEGKKRSLELNIAV